MAPGPLTTPLIHKHLLMVLPQPLTPCTHTWYPDWLPANDPNCAYTWLAVVWKGPGEKGPLMLVLNNTVDELDPVFHEYLRFCPDITADVIRLTEVAQASAGPTGTGPDGIGGGAVLTYTVAEPDKVPPDGQVAFPTAVTV